ncbi:MAG: RHS repeat-associated core domain-containing protein [Candidatus Solibacter usitatus]|nr:RHS repeat-associated core domain-containing protein [Candidatus Solibacter usitatus]
MWGDGQRVKFTGKERDAETGLDNFLARYYSAAQGRFTSADPTVITRDVTNPQSWNKYSYAFNRPTVLVDPDGRWPGWYHHQLIEQQFKAQLGNHAVQVIQRASDWVDSLPNQFPGRSFMHAMSNGDIVQSIQDAQRETDQYVDTEMKAAVDQQIKYEMGGGKGFGDDALTRFGHALHTVQDATSPQHRGYQPWYGLNDVRSILHSRREERSTVSRAAADMEARYNAQVAASQLWIRFQAAVTAERQRKLKEEQERRKKENQEQ